MAGIGFDLRRLLAEDRGVLSRLRAYASAGLIAAGPWLITMFSLMLVRFGIDWLEPGMADAFFGLVTYAFAFSLITVGGLQMAMTRWLADVLYERRYGALIPGFAAALIGVAACQGLSAAVFCWLVGFETELLLSTVFLYVALSLSWIALIWLTVIRQFDKILLAYAAGMAAFWLLLLAAGPGAGLAGAVGSFAGGCSLTVALMAGLILRGTEAAGPPSAAVYKSLGRYPGLLLVGFLYAASLWVDKLVFWFGEGIEVLPGVRNHPLYDTCFYLAYLTVVPALTINLVHLETSFYERYRGYFGAVTGGSTLADMERQRLAMEADLRAGTARLLRVQGLVTGACVVFAGPVAAALGLTELAARVFRLACLGAFFHVLFLVATLVLLYFDLRRKAVLACALFCAANLLLAAWSLRAGPLTYGLGYAVAGLLACACALLLVRGSLRDLHYLAFMGQPAPRA